MPPLTKSRSSDETETSYGIRVESIKAYNLATRYRFGLFRVKPIASIQIDGQQFNAGTFNFKSSQWEYRPICAETSELPATLNLQLWDPHVLNAPTPLGEPFEKVLESKERIISWEREQIDGSKTKIEVNLNFDPPEVTGLNIRDVTQRGAYLDSLGGLPTEEDLQNVKDYVPEIPWLSSMKGVCSLMMGVAELVGEISEIHPYLKMASSILGCVGKGYKKQVKQDQDIEQLLKDFTELYESLKTGIQNRSQAYRKSKKDLLMTIGIETVCCFYFVREYSSPHLITRMAKNAVHLVDAELAYFRDTLAELKEEVAKNIASNIELVVYENNEKLNSLATKAEISNIPYAAGASLLDRSRCCLPKTRTVILGEIYEWVTNYGEGAEQVMFLHGVAGEGKSAIAHSVAQVFNDLGCLGSSFRFDRNHRDRGATLLFPTIARDIADLEPPFRDQLFSIVENSTRIQTTEDLAEQFEMFLQKPLQNLVIFRPLVIVIDALDECDRSEDLIKLLATQKLPPQCRILVTSRYKHVLDQFKDNGRVLMRPIPSPSEEEIRVYIRRQLKDLIDSGDLTLQEAEDLAKNCQGLFQWAAVACTSIIGPSAPVGSNVRERYHEIVALGKKPNVQKSNVLDKLYRDILFFFFFFFF